MWFGMLGRFATCERDVGATALQVTSPGVLILPGGSAFATPHHKHTTQPHYHHHLTTKALTTHDYAFLLTKALKYKVLTTNIRQLNNTLNDMQHTEVTDGLYPFPYITTAKLIGREVVMFSLYQLDFLYEAKKQGKKHKERPRKESVGGCVRTER